MGVRTNDDPQVSLESILYHALVAGFVVTVDVQLALALHRAYPGTMLEGKPGEWYRIERRR